MESERFQDGNDRNVEEEADDEEEKVEKFFSLIRSFQEARNRRKEELKRESETKNEKPKTRRLNEQQSSSWVPSFVKEDFTGEIDFIRPPLVFPLPCNNKDEKKKKVVDRDDNGVDLKLTL